MDQAVTLARPLPVAALTYYDAACRALAQAHSVDEVAEINNEAGVGQHIISPKGPQKSTAAPGRARTISKERIR